MKNLIYNEKKNIIFFLKQLKKKKIFHANLIIGDKYNSKKISFFFAMSIFCIKKKNYNFFPCKKCINCQKILSNNFSNLFFLKNKIKKKDIINLKKNFFFTSIETNIKKKVYILFNIENSSKSALNSLLKILENPPKNLIAFLTTKNLNYIPKTISSRCLKFFLKKSNFFDIKNDISVKKIKKFILSFFLLNSNNFKDIKKNKIKNFDYFVIFIIKWFEIINYSKKNKIIFFLQNELIKKKKNKFRII